MILNNPWRTAEKYDLTLLMMIIIKSIYTTIPFGNTLRSPRLQSKS